VHLELDPLSLKRLPAIGRNSLPPAEVRRSDSSNSERPWRWIRTPALRIGRWAGHCWRKVSSHEAIAEFQKSIPLFRVTVRDEPAELARAYAMSGRRDEAVKDSCRAENVIRATNTLLRRMMASIYAALGRQRPRRSFALLNRGPSMKRDFILTLVQSWSQCSIPLRSDPRLSRISPPRRTV
jgi:hypothetical protein